MKRFIQRTAFSLASTALMTAAQAHEGHGLEGASHWHSTDAWGFMAAGAGTATGHALANSLSARARRSGGALR